MTVRGLTNVTPRKRGSISFQVRQGTIQQPCDRKQGCCEFRTCRGSAARRPVSAPHHLQSLPLVESLRAGFARRLRRTRARTRPIRPAVPLQSAASMDLLLFPYLIGNMDPNNNKQDLDLVAVPFLAQRALTLCHFWHSGPLPCAIFGTAGRSSHFWTRPQHNRMDEIGGPCAVS